MFCAKMDEVVATKTTTTVKKYRPKIPARIGSHKVVHPWDASYLGPMENYIAQHRQRFLDELFELLRLPSVSADPAFAPSVLATAEATARDVFEKGGVGDDLPTLTLAVSDLADGISIVQLLVKSGLAGSGKEAKRLIAEEGAKLNDAPLNDASLVLNADDFTKPIKLSKGKKKHALVQLG